MRRIVNYNKKGEFDYITIRLIIMNQTGER